MCQNVLAVRAERTARIPYCTTAPHKQLVSCEIAGGHNKLTV